MQNFRKLTIDEIKQLQEQNCICDQWESIRVAPDFNPSSIRSVTFSGEITLGTFRRKHKLEGGIPYPSGIENARIHNCHIGDDVVIGNIGGYLANCDIAEQAIILNTHTILTEGRSKFGNDVNSHVLNETGGREVPIHDKLSAQTAYILAMYRHRNQLMTNLNRMIAAYADSVASTHGTIGKGARIINCGSLRNVRIGEAARLYGVASLENGSINSNEDAICRIGSGVIARDFIFSSGTVISDGAQITRSFVGQASHVGHLFSAHDSLFFSNCQMENGEACAIFAGPYSVSMHKSSLLIAAMYSFLNAGSGFNQSNHMYKLGPIHQGIVERGGRMASDSYILWPARIGPFTMVMGRHMNHLDTTNLPFSYIIQSGTESHLVPGANLQRVGTIRDSFKWPARDKRTDPVKPDLINFDLLTPYTMRKIIKALDLLHQLQVGSSRDTLRFHYQGAIIKRSSLEKGIRHYEKSVDLYLGNVLIRYLKNNDFSTLEQLHELLPVHSQEGTGKWIDLAGFIVPQEELDKVLQRIEDGTIASVDQVQREFETLQSSYASYEWNWSAQLMESRYKIDLSNLSIGCLLKILNRWHEAFAEVNNHLLEDAAKEFHCSSQIGFGIDGNEQTRLDDFEAVRGTYEQQEFVRHIKMDIVEKNKTYQQLLIKLKDLK